MMAIGTAVPLCLSTFVDENHSATPIVPTAAPTQSSFTTISVLLIGVNSLTATHPTLESLTVVGYQTGVKNYFLFTVSPDTCVDPASATAPEKTIRSVYADDARLQRQALVTQKALRKISSKLSNIYVDVNFDRQAITETIGLLGPFDCMGQTQTGEALLRQFDALAPEAPEERMRFQGSLLKCLFDAAKKQGWDFPTLMDKLGRRPYPSRDHAAYYFGFAPPLAQSEFAVIPLPLHPPLDKPTPQP